MTAQDNETIVKYLNIFEDHLASLYPAGERNLTSTFLPSTNCCWTLEEKNVFFHALAIHSRLRPDLIAEALPTKTVVDVCTYIDLFEESLGRHPPFSMRQELPIAYDASEDWTKEESGLAEGLIEAEVRWEEERLCRLRKSRADTVMRTVKANANREDVDRETTRRAQKQARVEIKRGYTVEDVMRSLDGSHLKVLDIMLKEGDEASMLAATGEDFEGKTVHVQPAAASSQSGSNVHNDHAPMMDMDSTTDEIVIDPVLLATSAPEPASTIGNSTPSSTEFHSSARSQSYFDPSPAPTYDPYDEGHQTLPPPVASTSAAILDRSNNGKHTLQAALKEQLEYAQTLSPKSRKLYEKRVRMRFKRAELSGGVVSLDMHVKRGRKPKEEKSLRIGVKRKRPSDLDEDEETHEDGSDDEDAGGRCRPKGLESEKSEKQQASGEKPITRTSVQAKIQKMFQEGHVDYAMLQRENLDLFHLKNLECLMRLNNTLHNAPTDVNTRISEETLKFLHALVSIFVTDLVRQTIVCRELEGKVKRRTKVWRFKEGEITDSAVHHAAEMLGLRSFTKKEHFSTTLAALDYQGGDDDYDEEEKGGLSGSGPRSECSRDGSDHDTDDDNGQDTSSTPSLTQQTKSSLHREIQSPMFWLPRTYRFTTSSSSFPNKNYDDEGDVLWDFNNSDDNEIDESNMSALTTELEEESQLDVTDMAASEAYERDLRHVLAGKMTAQQAREKHERSPSTKRQRKSGRRPSGSAAEKAKVVSEPFIYEDDDDGVDDDDYVP